MKAALDYSQFQEYLRKEYQTMEFPVEEMELHKVITSFQSKFLDVRRREETLLSEITAKLPWHPRAELIIKLPRNQQLLCVLWVVRKELPWNVQVRLDERLLTEKAATLSSTLLRLKKDLSLPRWVLGRLPEVLARALGETQMFVRWDPKEARKKVRRRGHRESSLVSLEERPERRSRRLAETVGIECLPKQQQIQELQRQEFHRADVLLSSEALGVEVPTAADWNQSRSYESLKAEEAFWPTDNDPDVLDQRWEEEPASVSVSETEEDLCLGCRYAPRGSLLCASGSARCLGGKKPIR